MKHLARRLLLALLTLFLVSVVAFGAAHLIPGDPAEELFVRLHDRPPTEPELEELREELGLTDPVVVQYTRWVRNAARADFGTSYTTRTPVIEALVRRAPLTLQLALPAAALSVVLAIPLGLLSARCRNRLADQVLRILSLIGASIPSFWLALLLILYFSVRWSLVPVAGRHGLSSLILPVAALTVTPTAILSRFTRSAVLDVLGNPYVSTARAKGLPEVRVLGRHVLRNCFIPIITAFGLSLGHLLAGAVIIESIFAWPGLGSLAYNAILQRDYPMLQAFVLYSGMLFVAVNLLVDATYLIIDPRIRKPAP